MKVNFFMTRKFIENLKDNESHHVSIKCESGIQELFIDGKKEAESKEFITGFKEVNK